MTRAEITVSGSVQGVGFRYFVVRNADKLGLNGYTQNLGNGDVLTVVEGEKLIIEKLYEIIKEGPSHAHVKESKILWTNYQGEFNSFEVRF